MGGSEGGQGENRSFWRRSPVRRLAAVLAFGGLLVGGWMAAGLHVTLTGSLPSGIYRETGRQPQRGSIVIVCPPKGKASRVALKRGYLSEGSCAATGTKPLGKPAVAVPGDTVALTKKGIFVNGERLAESRPWPTDSDGRRVPINVGRWVLGKNTYYLFSDFRPRHSYDSRYFGPVQGNAHVVRPFLTVAEYTPPAAR